MIRVTIPGHDFFSYNFLTIYAARIHGPWTLVLIFICENNRRSNKVMHHVDFFIGSFEDMGIFHVFLLSFEDMGIFYVFQK